MASSLNLGVYDRASGEQVAYARGDPSRGRPAAVSGRTPAVTTGRQPLTCTHSRHTITACH